MFLKFICKVFFAKNIVKTERNSRINGRSSISMLFPGHSTTFRQNRQPFSGKPGDPADTNTAGKNALSQGRNKAERNCRHTRGAQQKKQKLPHRIFVRQLLLFGFETKTVVAFLFMIVVF